MKVNNEFEGMWKEAVMRYVEFEVLIVVIVKSTTFWDITTFRKNIQPQSSGLKKS
jgi:predicted Zn-dependent protease